MTRPISAPGFVEVSFNPNPGREQLCFSFRLLGRNQRTFPIFTLQPPTANGNCSYVVAVPDDISSRFCIIACMRDGNTPSYGIAMVDDLLDLESSLKSFGVQRGAIESWNRHYPVAQLPLESPENLIVYEAAMQRIMRGPA